MLGQRDTVPDGGARRLTVGRGLDGPQPVRGAQPVACGTGVDRAEPEPVSGRIDHRRPGERADLQRQARDLLGHPVSAAGVLRRFGNATGSDIDIGGEIAKRLGLTAQVQNSVFDTIIAALTGGKCDVIISAQNITADRVKQVDMIPFFQAGQSFVVATGNPKNIKAQDDLCGKAIGAETGTTEADYLSGSGDYKGQGLSAACTSKGKPAIDVKSYAKDSDALLALQTGKVDAYFADSPVAGYYTVQHPDQFQLSGLTLGVALEGISVQNDPGHKDLVMAVQQALVSMINDGTYLTILKKYGDESGAVTAAVAGQLNKTK